MTTYTAVLVWCVAWLLPRQVVYEGEPVLRAIKPFAPKSLAWLFPFEYGRADEIGSQGLNGIRLQSFIVSTSKFFTTLLLVAFPQTLWLQIYFFLTVPFRCVDNTIKINEGRSSSSHRPSIG